MVSESSLFRSKRGWAVYGVKDNRARVQDVTLGKRGDYEVAIEKGLRAGELVIRHPSDAIEEGVHINAHR